MPEFDDSRLDDPDALRGADAMLRRLAGAGARIRIEAAAAAEAPRVAEARPRAIVVAGAQARLLRSLLEPVCPVPLVAWPAAGLPGWVGPLDLVVVLSPRGHELAQLHTVREAVRRGSELLVATPSGTPVIEAAGGRGTVVVPTATEDQFAAAAVLAEVLHRAGLGPEVDLEAVAGGFDEVAETCSPFVDLATNPAKDLALALADAQPVVWGASVLAARAARRVAEALRGASGRPALAADAEDLLPVLAGAEPVDVFADPYDSPVTDRRPCLVLLDDGHSDDLSRVARNQLVGTAEVNALRVAPVLAESGGELRRHAMLMQTGMFAAVYLALGLGRTAPELP